MKNRDFWKPSKFIYVKNKLRGSKNIKYVSISSRLIADIIAGFYDKYLKSHIKGVLLDLGCGKVPLYEAYKSYIDNNICVDWTNSSQHIDFIADLNNKLTFNNSSFNTIILSDVLEHIKEPNLLWSEMNRILKINGKVIMNVPFSTGYMKSLMIISDIQNLL